MNGLSPATSRFAALSLLLLFILAIFFYGVIPVVKSFSDKLEEVEARYSQLVRYQYLVANEDRINRELERIDALGVEKDLFLKGNKITIASANLRELVNESIKRSGGQLVSSQEYEGDPLPSATPVGLRLQVSGEVQNLVDLLYELENARPIIFIDELSVTSSSAQVRSALDSRRPARINKTRSSLDIRLDIVGYLPGETG